jgi:hypothetical protein
MVEIQLKSSLSDSEKKGIRVRLYEQHITSIDADSFCIIYCPWCGVHLKYVIDFDKGVHAGQYTSKEGRER